METAVHVLERPHTARSSRLSSLGLLAPLVLAGLGRGISARRTRRLLDVERALSAATAQSVRLRVA